MENNNFMDNNNFMYTSNYLRNNIIQDSKKTTTQMNKTINYNNIEENIYNQQFIMSRGLTGTGSSNKTQDIRKIENENIKDKNLLTSLRISRINIDSRHRNLESKNILDSEIYYLDNNPINIELEKIIINHKNHPYQVNDNIIIQGIKTQNITLDNALTFIDNISYIRINHKNHNLNFNTINAMNIEISNFIGDSLNNTQFGNIPINSINYIHKIYPTSSQYEIPSNDYYYINIYPIISKINITYTLSSIIIIFKDINGINLNLLNANYPLNNNQIYGFQTISTITTNSYTINLNTSNNISIYGCGGNSIWVAKIIDYIEGYPQNNYYKIGLKKTFYNVSKIKLISTEFPNTEKVIKSIPENKKNNAFYWKIRNDGDEIYSIELNPGNYSIDLLKIKLKEKIESIKRNKIVIINNNITGYSYYENTICNIVIEPEIDFFSIEFFSKIFIPNAIQYKDSSLFDDSISRLIINHPNHNLIIDTNINITINNATSTDGIPVEILNSTFILEKIIDQNTYQIKLPKYTKLTTNIVTNGGDIMSITYPIRSQLYFDRLDTIGDLIGFHNVGQYTSITNFLFINTNTDLYYSEVINYSNKYLNNSFNLSGDNYILMTSPIFKESYNTGLVDNIFAKLLLTSNPGSVLYNQFIQLGETFSVPIPSFSEWEVSFYDTLNNLYNFGNLEHSYTLEIYEEINKLT
jgi:hypothetical protein